MNQLAIVLLAAGGSSRMGFPKQLIPFEGKKLVQIVAERLLACRCFPTVVILGGNSREVLPLLQGYTLDILENLDWQSGMSTSIRCAVTFVKAQYPEVTHLMFALVDQPSVQAEEYSSLVEAAKTAPNKVIAAFYAGQWGAPMIFPSIYWNDLLQLTGDRGAAGIVRKMNPLDVVSIEMPNAGYDWDSPADLPQNVKP
jgi:molybdenum cofactor cytidylyltransferase